MRKLEATMVFALRHNEPRKLGNTQVTLDGEGSARVWLFGNLIAIKPGDYDLWLSIGGCDSRTTRSRLRALLAGFGIKANLASYAGRPILETPYGARFIRRSDWMHFQGISFIGSLRGSLVDCFEVDLPSVESPAYYTFPLVPELID